MEADAAIGIRALRSVLQIPFYMHADRSELRPYLMMAPRMEIDLNEMIVI